MEYKLTSQEKEAVDNIQNRFKRAQEAHSQLIGKLEGALQGMMIMIATQQNLAPGSEQIRFNDDFTKIIIEQTEVKTNQQEET